MGLDPPEGHALRARWAGPAGLLAGGAALLALLALPGMQGAFAAGATYTLRHTDQLLALVGLAFALAQLSRRACRIGLVAFLAGIPVGGAVADLGLWLGSAAPGFLAYVVLVGPATCLLAGACLAAPPGRAARIAPPAALLIGMAVGQVASFRDISGAHWVFALGTISVGVWLVVTLVPTLALVRRIWLRLAGRIFGSWLIAIGLLLAAARLVPA